MRRCHSMIRSAKFGNAAFAEFFLKREIRATNDLCYELLLSIAESSSVADLVANRTNFERMREAVMEVNDILIERTQANPQTMSSILNAEDTFVDLLVAADPTVRLMAGFAKQHLNIVKSVLTSFFTDIGLQLKVSEYGAPSLGQRLGGALSAPLGALVRKKSARLLAQYGDGRCDRKADIVFMRSLYNKENSKLRSWPKVIAYVRNCRDEADPNFARCNEIRLHVQLWAKHKKGGIEMTWHSLAQQLKLSHGKKPKSGLGPCAIPDRSWADLPR